ncbi:MAG TPA: hypothetical protein VN158_10265, partial [Caulobacter sp.]|nr:hypothetical protein [Caulobacter sp.]
MSRLLTGLAACGLLALPAHAQLPTVKLMSNTLVSPSNVFPAEGHSDGVAAWASTPPEIEALARTLGAGRESNDQYAQNVLDYVRNNIDTEFRFGLGKGARGAVIDQSGTPFDQAELMAKLLTVGGVTPTFQAGTIRLDAATFGKWTGLVKGLDEGAQTFTVDAKAACKLLADGGIPATVNDGANCDALSGDLDHVIMASVWIKALGKSYDPSLKVNTLYQGVDVAARLNCGSSGCGAAMTAAATDAAVKGVVDGSDTITNVQETSLYQMLRDAAVRLQTSLQTSDPTWKIEQVVGGRRQKTEFSTAATASLSYATPIRTWSAIPDTLRTRLRVSTESVSTEFFSDELAGRRLQLVSDTEYTLDGAVKLGTPCSPCAGGYKTVNLKINHPYPASGGLYNGDLYGDDQVTMQIWADGDGVNLPNYGLVPITIVHGIGVEGPSSERHMAALQEAIPTVVNTSYTLDSKLHGLNYNADGQTVIAAKFLNQAAAADVLVGGLGKATITRHHDIGVIFGHPYNPGSMALMSVQSALSVAPQADLTVAPAVFQTSAALLSMLEGAVNQQITNGPA